jgi:hypothetical protein
LLENIMIEAEEWINQDIYSLAHQKLFKDSKSQAALIQPYSLFSRQPFLCGLMLFRLNMRLQEAGIVLVNAWGSLPTVLHLYNAVQHESPNDDFPRWEDLEAVINIHSKEIIFVGDYPGNPAEYLKRFCLMMGWSASIFAANSREGRNTNRTQTPASKRGPREITTISAITDIFGSQYCKGDARSDVTFHRIQRLLCASLNKQQLASPFLPVPFISALQEAVQTDILALNIDYFALHMRCWNLLREIQSTLHEDFVKFIQTSDYLEKESQLPFMVGYVFAIAAGSDKTAEIYTLSSPGAEVKSRTLLKAAEVAKTLVLKEGRAEIDRVEKYCRGYDWLSDGTEEKIMEI